MWACWIVAAHLGASPELPRVAVDLGGAGPGPTRVVPPSAFQGALDAAQPGDVLVLQAGQTYRGPFIMPRKTGSGWITVRGDSMRWKRGRRVGPADTAAMPKLTAAHSAVLIAAEGAHHYRFEGVELAPADGTALVNLVLLGDSQTPEQAVPHHFVFAGCVLHGDQARGGRRAIAMNSAHTAVVDSHLAGFGEVGVDSQAIAAWAGSGPFLLENNYLEGAAENVMFGGGDAPSAQRVPSDITIRGNHFRKPLHWQRGEPQRWAVKNLFELKNARRVLVDGNLFEHNWVHAQNGFAILFTLRNEDGRVPWAVIEDVTFTHNVVRHAASGINILGRDDNGLSAGRVQRVRIANNLFEDIGDARWGGGGRLFQLLSGTRDVVIENNAAGHTGPAILAEGEPHLGFVFRNNVVPHNEYGVIGTGTGSGLPTLARYFPSALFSGNVLTGGPARLYPPHNSFPAVGERVRQGSAGVDRSALSGALAAADP